MHRLAPDCSLCSQDLRRAGRKMQLMEAPCQERKLEVGLSFDQVSKPLVRTMGKLTVLMHQQEMLLGKNRKALQLWKKTELRQEAWKPMLLNR